MKNKNLIKNILAFASILGMSYCFAVFIYTQTSLKATAPVSETVTGLGYFVLPAMFLAGIYHVLLLFRALKALAGKQKNIFIHSLYIYMIILSGITLLSDVTIISDIGKEYSLLDVSGQWHILYVFTLFHIAVMILGTIFIKNAVGTHLLEEIKNGNDAMFISMNQIGIMCGVLGIAGVIVSVSGTMENIILETYRAAWMMFLSCLALFPLVLFIIYWAIKYRKKPLAVWLDEKQALDSAIGALVSTLIALFLIVIFMIISIFAVDLPAILWLSIIFFIYLITFSGTILTRNRFNTQEQ